MTLTEHLPADRHTHVEARPYGNLMEGLTTVRPDGQPVTVPVSFLLREVEGIGALFGTAERFAALFSAAVLITPAQVWV